ncbi:helix-turn-helix domain-containing protein [Paraburkholderia bannensis]|uniref:helix-turn-helix domain-containing protein n=1 Tax=Paraburkholderia bannensis TaxID=765414 RepID=UPI002ABDF9AC|nr:helix-turn-helix domain-containing protein [Paraburkholderia bannensis]
MYAESVCDAPSPKPSSTQRPPIPVHPGHRTGGSGCLPTRCSTCSLRAVCMPADLSGIELRQLDTVVLTTRHVRRGEALFRTHDVFQSLYAVRTGSFKTIVMHRDGREQVIGFQIPGEPLGLDGVCSGTHCCEAIALEDSTVCIIPFAQFESLCRESRRMQRHLYYLMSSEIVRESSLMMMLGTMTAEQRLASFLLDLAARFRARGYSSAQFNLKMSREEIGCYLGLKLETVSRMFSRFHRDGLVEPKGKQIHIVDAQALARV